MKTFHDTGNIEDSRSCAQLGVIDGVTANPSSLAKEAGSWREALRMIAQLVPGPISAEVVSQDLEGMIREGHDLAGIAPNITDRSIQIFLDDWKKVEARSREG